MVGSEISVALPLNYLVMNRSFYVCVQVYGYDKSYDAVKGNVSRIGSNDKIITTHSLSHECAMMTNK
jgi:hypothetical protein